MICKKGDICVICRKPRKVFLWHKHFFYLKGDLKKIPKIIKGLWKIAQTAFARLRFFSTKQLCCRKLRLIHRRAIQIATYFQFCTVLALFFVGACSSFSRAGIIEGPKKIIDWTISGTNCNWWNIFKFHGSTKISLFRDLEPPTFTSCWFQSEENPIFIVTLNLIFSLIWIFLWTLG